MFANAKRRPVECLEKPAHAGLTLGPSTGAGKARRGHQTGLVEKKHEKNGVSVLVRDPSQLYHRKILVGRANSALHLLVPAEIWKSLTPDDTDAEQVYLRQSRGRASHASESTHHHPPTPTTHQPPHPARRGGAPNRARGRRSDSAATLRRRGAAAPECARVALALGLGARPDDTLQLFVDLGANLNKALVEKDFAYANSNTLLLPLSSKCLSTRDQDSKI